MKASLPLRPRVLSAILLVAVLTGGGLGPDLRAQEKEKGRPAQVPPAEAKGRELAAFIQRQKAQGLRGQALADAVAKERRRLGLPDEPDPNLGPQNEKARQLAEFIQRQRAQGLKGPALADAIAKERQRLGLPAETPAERGK